MYKKVSLKALKILVSPSLSVHYSLFPPKTNISTIVDPPPPVSGLPFPMLLSSRCVPPRKADCDGWILRAQDWMSTVKL